MEGLVFLFPFKASDLILELCQRSKNYHPFAIRLNMKKFHIGPIIFLLAMALAFGMPEVAPASYLDLQGATFTPLLTTYGDPANYTVTAPSFYDGVAKLIVTFPSGTIGGSAALLAGGQYLLTAAHMVLQGGSLPTSLSATFYLAGGSKSLSGAQYFVNPGWDGDVNHGNDIAIVKLATTAPIAGYQIYRDPNTVDVVANLAGYGQSGTGSQGNVLPWGTLRQGLNRYDGFWDMSGYPYALDFDNGFAANDALGKRYGVNDLGTGTSEVDLAFGDSGGPSFIDGKIAGVHSFIDTFGMQYGDIDSKLNSSFGEVAGDMRVAAYSGWIDNVTAVPLPPTFLLLGSGLLGLAGWRRSGKG
jgi:secreted trypsin-like serine protease